MRPLARYAFTATRGAAGIPTSLSSMSSDVRTWLSNKGWDHTSADFAVDGGRVATVDRADILSRSGRAERWTVSQPTDDGRTQFNTQLTVGERGDEFAVYCELSAVLLDDALTPLYVDARCPSVLRTIVRPHSEWFYGSSRLAGSVLEAKGVEQGQILVRFLQDAGRSLPTIVVSSHNGLYIQSGLAASLASDLLGLATVIAVDDSASWQVSESLGREWSCYNGAIRLYWPLPIPGGSPARHPLWTASRLLDSASSVEDATRGLRNYLRRRLMAVSVFAVRRPGMLATLESEASAQQREEMLAKASETNEWREIAESFAADVETEKGKVTALEDENDTLRHRVYLLQTQAAASQDPREDLLPPDVEPSSLAQAVNQAKSELHGRVVFGRDVERGVAGLRPDAGPPQKVLEYLRALGDLVDARRKGSLGNSLIGWLQDSGATGSGESATDRNNPDTMRRRRWHDGVDIRQFELHLKPNENLGPDRCVRIYFDWDDATRQVAVGWIGRHPD